MWQQSGQATRQDETTTRAIGLCQCPYHRGAKSLLPPRLVINSGERGWETWGALRIGLDVGWSVNQPRQRLTLSFLPYHARSTLARSLSSQLCCIHLSTRVHPLRRLLRRNNLTKFPSSIHPPSSPRSPPPLLGWITDLPPPHLETRTTGGRKQRRRVTRRRRK